ncbi:MAG TPA: polymorphic toxin-type HINT domain-containing protein, partial [Tepidisphaeraceae bacterium]
ADSDATSITKQWKLLTIDATRVLPDGTPDTWQVQTLQPPEWLRRHQADVGGLLALDELVDLAEMGVPAGLVGHVQSIKRAPRVAQGHGRVVLTTVNHLNDYVFDVALEDQHGSHDNLGVTGFHKFYSEDRHGWVSAADLHDGEQLRGESGPIHVLSVMSLPGTQQVYNFTVEADHVYYVGDLTALTHNNGCGRRGSPSTRADVDAKRDAILQQHPDWTHTHGGTDAVTGAPKPEMYIPGPDGVRKGSTYPDLSFKKPDGTLHHHNTVDTYADGLTPTRREAANADKLQQLRRNDTYSQSAKPKG